MDGICSTKFWDANLTWSDTTTPVFTSCFIKLGLIWGPIAFFWVFATFEIYYSMRKKAKTVPWSALNVSKLVGVIAIMIVSLADMVYQMIQFSKTDVHPIEYYTPFLIFVTMAAIITLMLIEKKKGMITSGVLFLFWLLMFVGTAGGYYTALQKTFNPIFDYDKYYERYEFTIIVLYFVLSFIQFILNCFADRRTKPSEMNPV